MNGREMVRRLPFLFPPANGGTCHVQHYIGNRAPAVTTARAARYPFFRAADRRFRRRQELGEGTAPLCRERRLHLDLATRRAQDERRSVSIRRHAQERWSLYGRLRPASRE